MKKKEAFCNPTAGSSFVVPVLLIIALLLFSPIWGKNRAFADQEKNNEKVVMLQLPFTVEGDYLPLSWDEIHVILEKDVEDSAPNVDMVVPQTGDERLRGLDLKGDITIRDAMKLAESYGAKFVVWGTLKFSKTKKTMEMGAGNIRYLLTVNGLAQVRVYDKDAMDIVVDQPMVQSENDTTRAIEDSEQYRELEKRLGRDCVSDLSENLVKSVKNSLEKIENKK